MRELRLLLFLCIAMLVFSPSAIAADRVRVTMSTSSTKSVVDTPWRYTIVVSDAAGKPLAAKVRLQALRNDRVVSCWKAAAMRSCSGATAGTWIAFTGRRTGTIMWPPSSVGKLIFRATVVAGTRSLRLRAPVTVRLP